MAKAYIVTCISWYPDDVARCDELIEMQKRAGVTTASRSGTIRAALRLVDQDELIRNALERREIVPRTGDAPNLVTWRAWWRHEDGYRWVGVCTFRMSGLADASTLTEVVCCEPGGVGIVGVNNTRCASSDGLFFAPDVLAAIAWAWER